MRTRAGEVYVLNDGGEVDLDLGNYERYLDVTLSRDNNITTGKIYSQVIEKEVSYRLVNFGDSLNEGASAARRLSWKDSTGMSQIAPSAEKNPLSQYLDRATRNKCYPRLDRACFQNPCR